MTGKVIKGGSVGEYRGMRREERAVEEGVYMVVLLADVVDGNVIPPLCFDI